MRLESLALISLPKADVIQFTLSVMATGDIYETTVVSSGIAASYEGLQCKITILNWPILANASTTPSTNCESNNG